MFRSEMRPMDNFIEKPCPNCGQYLRIPNYVGGVVMVCPSCDHQFASGFKMQVVEKCQPKEPADDNDEVLIALRQRFPRFFKS